MVDVLAVVVVLLAVVVVGNVAVTLAVVRRLRAIEGSAPSSSAGLPAIGRRVGTFTATTVAGGTVTGDELSAHDESIVALLSAGCGSCDEVAGQLRDGRSGLPASQVYVFILGAIDHDTEALAARLGEEITVTVTTLAEITAAFGANTFPTLLRLRRGAVAAVGHILAEVAVSPVGATR